MSIFNKLRKIRPLKKQEKDELGYLKEYLKNDRIKLIKQLLKEKKISVGKKPFESKIITDIEYPFIKSLNEKIVTDDVNQDIRKQVVKKAFNKFSDNAFEILPHLIAPNIKGMIEAKQAATLQLFAPQPVHVLLIGDPGTGKTDVLRSVFNLAEDSSFGLGSGTSGAGLVVTVKGNKIMKGLLPLADQGICCIDELNLMKEDNRAGLYSAMEKGFVTYDKGGHHYQFDARVKVLATANPLGDEFKGKNVDEIKGEMPFDSALLTRFHMTFFVRKPTKEQFKEIATKIVSQDLQHITEDDKTFIKEYIKHTQEIEVKEISKELQQKIVDYMADLKQKEKDYLVEISPRLIIGFMRMTKSLARMEGREKVIAKDVERVRELLGKSIKI